MINQNSKIHSLFPTPIYVGKRDSNLIDKEAEEIKEIFKEGVHKNISNSTTDNSYIFNERLKELKQFCEQQLKIYVKEIINPKEELDLYITQSWLNITKPGEYHHEHSHSNSIISGVFYIHTEEGDCITFGDPNFKIKEVVKFNVEFNTWNAAYCSVPSYKNELLLFPSWLDHQVHPNINATTNRISISFNTFVRGVLGREEDLYKLVLK